MRECSPPPNMSRVTCYVLRVTCHMSHVTFFFGQSGEAYQWRVCYQRGLPRLVYHDIIPNPLGPSARYMIKDTVCEVRGH